jgi:hypothetical protein
MDMRKLRLELQQKAKRGRRTTHSTPAPTRFPSPQPAVSSQFTSPQPAAPSLLSLSDTTNIARISGPMTMGDHFVSPATRGRTREVYPGEKIFSLNSPASSRGGGSKKRSHSEGSTDEETTGRNKRFRSLSVDRFPAKSGSEYVPESDSESDDLGVIDETDEKVPHRVEVDMLHSPASPAGNPGTDQVDDAGSSLNNQPLIPVDTTTQTPASTVTPITYTMVRVPYLDGVGIITELDAIVCLLCGHAIPATFLARHFREGKTHTTLPTSGINLFFEQYHLDPQAGVPKMPPPGCHPIDGLAYRIRIICKKCDASFDEGSKRHEKHGCPSTGYEKFPYCLWLFQGGILRVTDVAKSGDGDGDGGGTVGEWMLARYLDILRNRAIGQEEQIQGEPTHPFYRRLGFDGLLKELSVVDLKKIKAIVAPPENRSNRDEIQSVIENVCYDTFYRLHKRLQNPTVWETCAVLTGDD